MSVYLNELFTRHLGRVLAQEPVSDDPEEMNWRLFFAHSQDMQGFAADIFVGGPSERRHPTDSSFRGLRERWGRDSKALITDLGSLWAEVQARKALEQLTLGSRGGSVDQGIAVLRSSGRLGAMVFADTLDSFKTGRGSRKTNKMIRAYVQNSALLLNHGASFRQYLQTFAQGSAFPPQTSAACFEATARDRIERDFYNVGPQLANYLISDWLLGLWKDGCIDWFESYKKDSVHEQAIEHGLLPREAGENFIDFCRTVHIPPEYGAVSGKPCPPRVLNACLWQDGNRSSGIQTKPRPVSPRRQVQQAVARDVNRSTRSCELIEEFRDNDRGYCAWLAAHRDGYVLNVNRRPKADYLNLHRPDCPYIVGPIQRQQRLTQGYIKICSVAEADLVAWCRKRFRVEPQSNCYCLSRIP